MLKCDILFDKAFYTKKIATPNMANMALGNLSSSSKGCAMTVTMQAYFWVIWPLLDERKLYNRAASKTKMQL